MGRLLEQIYGIVEKKGGYNARMSLAVKTGISRVEAGQVEDSEELAKRFLQTASEILGENITPLLKKGDES